MAESVARVDDIEPYRQKLKAITKYGFRFSIEPSHVLDHLYIGSEDNATDPKKLQELGITHVINTVESYLETGQEFYDDGVKYMGFAAEDEEDYNILQHFDAVYEFIEDARKNDGKAFIHCLMGVNRSGSLAIGYIMVHKNIGPIAATKLVKETRPLILTNEHFQWLLVKFAQERGLLILDKEELSE